MRLQSLALTLFPVTALAHVRDVEIKTTIPLKPLAGSETGLEFQACLSPHQERDEEMNTPLMVTGAFH